MTPSNKQSILETKKVTALLEENGILSLALKGFEPRLQQRQMMENVIQAYNENEIALIEAGTGTGKSLAYLIPAILWAAKTQERTVISTHTITLQEQLIHQDIPRLLKALNLDLKVVLVKGMNNYLCLRKLEDAQSDLVFYSQEEKDEMDKIGNWKRTTIEGSKAELGFAPSSGTWERLGAEREACNHVKCPHYNQCYYFKARRDAQDAQLLIVNHHLLFADIVKRADQNNYDESAILPSYKRIILDEAHHIEEIATEYFANRIHRIELLQVLAKLTSERVLTQQGKLPALKDKIQSLYTQAPPENLKSLINRLTIDLPAFKHVLTDQIHRSFDYFADFIQEAGEQPSELVTAEDSAAVSTENKLRLLEHHYKHPKWLDTITPETKQLVKTLSLYVQQLRGLESDLKYIENDRLQEQTKSIRLDIQALAFRLEGVIEGIDLFLIQPTSSEKVRWMEMHPLKTLRNVQLVDAELDISKTLVNFLFSKFPTIVLCSATLTSNRQFKFIKERLGVTKIFLPNRKISENIYDSPFDYHKQALLAIPTDMPLPTDPGFNQAAFEQIFKSIEISRGGVFVLFTSYSSLKMCAEVLRDRLKEKQYTLYQQGENQRRTLLKKFKETPRAVLFGTDSFWEGVDVAGDALRCVIIVKLPFRVPSDPMVQARTEAIAQAGGNAFFDLSVPQAIVKFKQGFGRLIRHKWDRGCIICLDKRLLTKGYGKLFLNSLPPCNQLFEDSEKLWPKIAEFYKQTYYFVKRGVT